MRRWSRTERLGLWLNLCRRQERNIDTGRLLAARLKTLLRKARR